MAETGRYLYAIARGVEPSQLQGSGLDGAPLAAVEHRGLVAVVSDVDLGEYGEEGLRRNLEDLTWLERVARGHDSVVQQVAALAPTAPLRLATICLDDAGVRARLDEWYDALQTALDRVEGRQEWSVKAFAAPGEPTEPTEPAEPAPAGGGAREPGAGAAYLRRKKTETVQRQSAHDRAAEVAEQVHQALVARAVASRRLQPQDPRLTGHQGTMTLNGAYLVEESAAAGFAAEVEALAAAHPEARLDVHGPWPPYSFATLDAS
ncbi:MAG: GvpL/GvpF family gas vesicle protein [Nocardioidaceae bacterium]